MDLNNFGNLDKFVKDNFRLFDCNSTEYSIKKQREAFKSKNQPVPKKLYSSKEISDKIQKLFDDYYSNNDQFILDIYRRKHFDKGKTYEELINNTQGLELSQNKLNIKLSEEDKSIPIIFVSEHFDDPKKEVNQIDDLETFVENNIVAFTAQPSRFQKNKLNELAKGIVMKGAQLHYSQDIERYLKEQFDKLDANQLDDIFKRYESGETLNKISKYYAVELITHKKSIEAYLIHESFNKLKNCISDEDALVDNIADVFSNVTNIDRIRTDLKKIISRFLPLILSNGFPDNITNVDSGIMVANAGDSAQFIFIARAILAGFDSSNVDVRSSRYDCIVEYKGKIFRVQVKGISQDKVYYKDRDRGGAGIDHQNVRNRGRRITSNDCDIYAAVDKKTGIVYLIPIKYLEDNKDKDSENIQDIIKYRENSKIFSELVE